jgi:undecaprenyl-diphosphatase
LLHTLLQLDGYLTSAIGFYAHPKTNFQRAVSSCCKVLEISGHGVPWFLLCGILLLSYLYTGNRTLFDYGLNMFVVLLVDILIVAPVKVLFKRPRPHLNIGSIPLSVSSVDNYAFPSGHASRCVALAAYFCYMPPFNPWTHLWYIWGLLVSLSRVALGRHHVLDVAAGMLAGLFIFDVVRRSGILFGV